MTTRARRRGQASSAQVLGVRLAHGLSSDGRVKYHKAPSERQQGAGRQAPLFWPGRCPLSTRRRVAKVRIAIWHNLPSGGGKRALYNQIQGFLKRGHTVESWCPSTADQTYLPLGDLVPEHVVPLTWMSHEKETL